MNGKKKREIRRYMLARREAMPQDEVSARSRRVTDLIRNSRLYRAAEKVCLYMPVRGEVDVRSLAGEKETYFPRVCGKEMEFALYEGEDRLSPGAFGIPAPASETVLFPDENTLIIVPGVAFSRRGDRIGYGGGYYDAYLTRHPEAHSLAAAYDFQIAEALPVEANDFRVEAVAGESEIFSD